MGIIAREWMVVGIFYSKLHLMHILFAAFLNVPISTIPMENYDEIWLR